MKRRGPAPEDYTKPWQPDFVEFCLHVPLGDDLYGVDCMHPTDACGRLDDAGIDTWDLTDALNRCRDHETEHYQWARSPLAALVARPAVDHPGLTWERWTWRSIRLTVHREPRVAGWLAVNEHAHFWDDPSHLWWLTLDGHLLDVPLPVRGVGNGFGHAPMERPCEVAAVALADSLRDGAA